MRRNMIGTRNMSEEVSNNGRREFLKRVALGLTGIALLGLTACSGLRDDKISALENGVENKERYPMHEVTATIYYIGERESADNDYISNVPSAWDSDAAARFGGIDTPEGKLTRNFEPKHNPFYFALPASEFNEDGLIPGAREKSPWANESVSDDESLFKGRWIKVKRGEKTIYAQWHDVGPNVKDDYGYVFGTGEPKNTFKLKAGLDLSPDAAEALEFDYEKGGAKVTWQFVNEAQVPYGAWKDFPPIDNKTYWE